MPPQKRRAVQGTPTRVCSLRTFRRPRLLEASSSARYNRRQSSISFGWRFPVGTSKARVDLVVPYRFRKSVAVIRLPRPLQRVASTTTLVIEVGDAGSPGMKRTTGLPETRTPLSSARSTVAPATGRTELSLPDPPTAGAFDHLGARPETPSPLCKTGHFHSRHVGGCEDGRRPSWVGHARNAPPRKSSNRESAGGE